MLRKIINIDESKCDGCGDCVPVCAEGALQIIDGKVRLISDLFCDGLGACIGFCPRDALKIEEREAEPYDEMKVMQGIVKGGQNVIKAHLLHLREHNEIHYLQQAIQYLEQNNLENPLLSEKGQETDNHHAGCPGSHSIEINLDKPDVQEVAERSPSFLSQWPIQLHLVSPVAPYYHGADLLLAADCTGFACPNFHQEFLKDKKIAIACPKLDTNKNIYIEKLIMMINQAGIKSITVLIMQVPCCKGLLQIAQQALQLADRQIPLKGIIVGINGAILDELTIKGIHVKNTADPY